jgi:TfoX/Sxy family transcriptional regulator of competence genes
MAWEKSSPRLIAAFDALVPPPPAERRKMFGYPAAFVNGQLFMGLWQEELMLRLPEGDRSTLQRLGGKPFEPMEGRPMREYVSVPAGLIYDAVRLKPWVDKALAYARSLPPKFAGKKKTAKVRVKKSTAKPARTAAATAGPVKPKGVKSAKAAPKPSSRSRAKPRTGR